MIRGGSKQGYTPSRALAELAEQHASLCTLMERCEELADAFDAGDIGPTQLLREVARLRIAFDAHNQFEEQLLRPVLLDAGWLGTVAIARMVEAHVAEHRVMREKLGSTPTSELRVAIASLRAHLDAEAQHFLSGRGLHDRVG